MSQVCAVCSPISWGFEGNGDFATGTLLLWSSENNWNASPPGLSDTYFVANDRRGFGCQQGFSAYEGDFGVGAVDGLCRKSELAKVSGFGLRLAARTTS